MGTAYAAERLGFSQVTIWRALGDLPHLRVGAAIRIPRQLVEDAREAVMAGRSIVLSDFAREWASSRAVA